MHDEGEREIFDVRYELETLVCIFIWKKKRDTSPLLPLLPKMRVDLSRPFFLIYTNFPHLSHPNSPLYSLSSDTQETTMFFRSSSLRLPGPSLIYIATDPQTQDPYTSIPNLQSLIPPFMLIHIINRPQSKPAPFRSLPPRSVGHM